MQLNRSAGFDLLQSMRARLAFLAGRDVGAGSSQAVGRTHVAPMPGASDAQTPTDMLANARPIEEQVLGGARRRQTRSAKRKLEHAQGGTKRGAPQAPPKLTAKAQLAAAQGLQNAPSAPAQPDIIVPVAHKPGEAATCGAASARAPSPERSTGPPIRRVHAKASASLHEGTQPAEQRISAASVSTPAGSRGKAAAVSSLKLSAAQLQRLHSWSFMGGPPVKHAAGGHPASRSMQPKKAQRAAAQSPPRSLEQPGSSSPAQPMQEAQQEPSRAATTGAGADRAHGRSGGSSPQRKKGPLAREGASVHEPPSEEQRPPHSTASAAGAARAFSREPVQAADACDDAAYDALQPLLLQLDPLGSASRQATEPAERHSTAAASAAGLSMLLSMVAGSRNLIQQAHVVQQRPALPQRASAAVMGVLPHDICDMQAAGPALGAEPAAPVGLLRHPNVGPRDTAQQGAALPAKIGNAARSREAEEVQEHQPSQPAQPSAEQGLLSRCAANAGHRQGSSTRVQARLASDEAPTPLAKVAVRRAGGQLGVFTLGCCEAGEVLLEITGEVVRRPVAKARMQRVSGGVRADICRMMALDADHVLDWTHAGNIGRFINPSARPNCKASVTEVAANRRILLVSLRQLAAGEELTYAPDSLL